MTEFLTRQCNCMFPIYKVDEKESITKASNLIGTPQQQQQKEMVGLAPVSSGNIVIKRREARYTRGFNLRSGTPQVRSRAPSPSWKETSRTCVSLAQAEARLNPHGWEALAAAEAT